DQPQPRADHGWRDRGRKHIGQRVEVYAVAAGAAEAMRAVRSVSSIMLTAATPSEISDPINARILAVSEDRIAGFLVDPFAEIARIADLDVTVVHERLRAMLAAGTIRRIRQTLMATNLAPGALVAWRVDNDELDAAFQ